MVRKIAAGNWKMNGLRADVSELNTLSAPVGVEVVICPPATLIHAAASAGSAAMIGAQDCHTNEKGAHTGDVSAVQLADSGAKWVIVGHSERRTDHAETDEAVRAKAIAAHQSGLTTIICVGETEAQRDAGEALAVIAAQLAGSVPDCATAQNTVIAYEPVWAIGTGRVPSDDQIAEIHAALRLDLTARFADGADFALLYGGSVKGSNAAQIFAVKNVDGALVGGASLTAKDFQPIIDALAAS
ncbi:MAG: triose-phosphate isomerase [Paracoccus denitrificans]|nr:MAG: triose-phosphate isomerase [Paracoccus denitrificans]PZO82972.1 MAG: triose-phosphate isomerase [Paracoccus denitrificans]